MEIKSSGNDASIYGDKAVLKTPYQEKEENSWLKERSAAWAAGLPPHVSLFNTQNVPTMIAVGGGKGGVGKSLISANLAAKLGSAGYKVLLVDLDMGGANLHTYLGMGMASKTLADFVLYEQKSFDEVVLPTPNKNVMIIAGGKDEAWSVDGDGNTAGGMNVLWDSLFQCKERNGFDFVILDLGAGTHRHNIDFFQSAHLGILTVLPEPTSIENAYTFLKASMCRLIENVGTHLNEYDAAIRAKELLSSSSKMKSVGYAERLRSMHKDCPEFIEGVFYALAGRQLGIVVNQIRSQRDIDIGHSMDHICQNFFAYQTNFLGYMNFDEAAWKALRNRRLLVNDFPHAVLTKRVNELARNAIKCLGYK